MSLLDLIVAKLGSSLPNIPANLGATEGADSSSNTVTRPNNEGRTVEMWMPGDPFTDEFYFGGYRLPNGGVLEPTNLNMITLPRINPDNVGEFVQFWAETMDRIEGFINGGGGLDLTRLFGAGRFVDLVITEGAIEMNGGLSVSLPAHEKGYLIQGKVQIFSDSLVITNMPLNRPKASDGSGGAYGYIEFDSNDPTFNTYIVTWYNELPDDSPSSEGKPCIGRVFTNDSIVTEIDNASADYIQNSIYSRQLIASLRSRIEILESLITGGATLSGDSIPITEGSSQSIKTYIDRSDSDLQDQVDLVSGGRDILPMLLPSDIQVNTLARMAVGIGEKNPHALDRLEMAVVLSNLHGDGTHGSPNYVGPGTVHLGEDGRTFEP